MELNDKIRQIFEPHVPEIIELLKNQVLEDVIDIVLECIYKQICDGKIRIEGVLNKDEILLKSIEKVGKQR